MPRRAKGRANGEGSIYEYPKGSGIWYAQIRLEDGTPKRRRAGSQRDAREKLRELLAEQEHGVNLAAQQPTVAQWCAIWLESFAINLKPNIKEDYAAVIRRYITNAPIGRRKLSQLTPADVQSWVNALSKKVAPPRRRSMPTRWIPRRPVRLPASPNGWNKGGEPMTHAMTHAPQQRTPRH